MATDSAVYVGQTGQYGSRRFEVLGHVQYQHPAGGVWDEWYLSFPGERWLWLAEAQGKLYMTQERTLGKTLVLPSFDTLSAGQEVELGRYGPQTVAEVNEAVALSAEGEIPFRFVPGAACRFVDLTGADHRFSTIDYSDTAPRVFVGREATLVELGLSAATVPNAGPIEIQGLQLACPNCGGALELKVPDQAQRVTCPFCSSLLDVEQGNLKYLSSLGTKKVRPLIAIGSEGKLAGIGYTVVGFVRRAVRFDKEYTWDEYLLYAPGVGFRWLVHSDCHWSFVEPLAAGDVGHRASEVVYNRRHFRHFQRAWAEVKYVLGEMYWKLKIGEVVLADDFVAPPQMISIERTPAPGHGPSGRINADNEWMGAKFNEEIYSLGTYVPHADIEKGFGVANLPRGWVIAPNQPARKQCRYTRTGSCFVPLWSRSISRWPTGSSTRSIIGFVFGPSCWSRYFRYLPGCMLGRSSIGAGMKVSSTPTQVHKYCQLISIGSWLIMFGFRPATGDFNTWELRDDFESVSGVGDAGVPGLGDGRCLGLADAELVRAHRVQFQVGSGWPFDWHRRSFVLRRWRLAVAWFGGLLGLGRRKVI